MLENRRIGIFVDGDDVFRRAHASQVLNGSRNAYCDVEVGVDRLPCLTDLHGVGDVFPRVDRCTRGAHCCTDGVSNAFQMGEVLG